MSNKSQRSVLIAITAAVLLVTGMLAVTLLGPGPVRVAAQEPSPALQAPGEMPRTITVVGEGRVRIQPDIAQINIGIEVVGETVKEASGQGAETMTAVMNALKEGGVEEKDMQTSGYSVWVERPYGSEGPIMDQAPIYHVNNTVNVTIRDLDTVGTILDAAIEAGANNIYGVTFSIADPKPLQTEAREKAVADALAKAEELAGLNQVQLGEVVSVSEVIGGGPSGYYPGFARVPVAPEGMGGGGGGPISPGELEMAAQLQVTYAIE